MPRHPFHRPGVRRIAAALVVSATIACESTSASSARGFSRIDSAGVAIAANQVAVDGLEPVLEVDPAPILRIGAVDGAEEQLFSDIVGLARLSDGRIAVANGNPPEIRIFGARGEYLGKLGGRGGGPGEFRYLSTMFAIAGDTLLAVNNPQFQLLRFTPDGGYVDARTISRDSVARRIAPRAIAEGTRAWFGNGAYVIFARDSTDRGDDRPDGVLFRPTSTMVWIDAEQTRSRDIGTFGDIQQLFIDLGGGRRMPLVPPGARRKRQAFGARGSRLCVAPNDEPDVHCVDAGGAHLIIRWNQQPVATADSSVERWGQRLRESAARTGASISPGEAERLIAAAVIPPTVPPVNSILVDADGNVLVHGPDIPQPDGSRPRYRIFSADGALMGLAILPRLQVLEIGDDYLLGVAPDTDGIEFVVLHRLTRR